MPKLLIRALGGLQICSGAGRSISVPTRKAQALLVYLAMHPGGPQPRAKIAALLWEESSEPQARASLRQSLTILRKTLDLADDDLVTASEAVELRAGCADIDAIGFERLLDAGGSEGIEQAVGQYRGEFLEGFDPKAPGFQDWASAERSRLRERAVEAMSRLLARSMQANETDRAVTLAVRLLALDPLQEPVHRSLMQLYVRQGRAASALRQFQICREILQRELATSPDPPTEALYRQIQSERRNRSRQTSGENLGTPAADADAPGDEERPQIAETGAGSEIRQVTVMACELADAGELGGDPEQARLIADRFHQLTRGIVESYGGTMERLFDDSVVALFGVAAAHSNDSERALRAALQIREAARFLGDEHRRSPAVRIGVVDGRLLVSRLPANEQRPFAISGAAIGAAARLAAEADSDEVLVTGSIYRQLSELLMGAQRRILAPRAGDERTIIWCVSDIREQSASPTPFVGRRSEVAAFGAALASIRETRSGLTILVRGEAGIGKTRLVQELAREARKEGYACHTGLVLDFGVGKGEGAIPAVVRGLLGLGKGSGLDHEAIAEAVAAGLLPADREMFLHELLQAGQPGHLRTLFGALDNANRERLTRDTLIELVRRASRHEPFLIVIEDLHWAGPATLELAAAISAAVRDCLAIAVLTTRTDGDPFNAAWRARAGPIVTMDIGPLSFDEAAALAGATVAPIDPVAIRGIERSGGNPFFLEQLLHDRDAAENGLPGSIRAVVQARIDRLETTDRATLRIASVLGQRFSIASLGALVDSADRDCSGLIGQGLLKLDGEDYLFAHALVQESAYLSLPKSERKELHLKAADWYGSRDLALRAAHLDRAESPAAPGAYRAAASSQAAEYRYDTALALIRRGEELAAAPAERFALAQQRGDLLREKGAVTEAAHAYGDALAVAGNDAERAKAWLGRAAVKRLTDDIPGAFADLELAREAAHRLRLDEIAARAHLLHGNLLFPRGDITGCLREQRLGLECATRAGSDALKAAALGGIGDAEYLRGHMRSAHERFKQCVTIADELGLARIAVANRPMAAVTCWYCGDTSGALAEALAAIDVAAKAQHRRAEAVSHHIAYICLHSLLQLDAARRHVDRALVIAEELRAPRFEAEAFGFRAELNRLAGRRSDALADLDRALAISRDVGMDYMGPIFLGTLARATGDPEVRASALTEGNSLLAANRVAHNHFLFRRDAIEACLECGDYDEAQKHAAALDDFARPEPLPWTEFVVARANALIAFECGERGDNIVVELRRLRLEAGERGYFSGLPRIEATLAAASPSR